MICDYYKSTYIQFLISLIVVYCHKLYNFRSFSLCTQVVFSLHNRNGGEICLLKIMWFFIHTFSRQHSFGHAGAHRQWPEVSDFVARFCTLRRFFDSRNMQKRVTQIIYLGSLPRGTHSKSFIAFVFSVCSNLNNSGENMLQSRVESEM